MNHDLFALGWNALRAGMTRVRGRRPTSASPARG
jgi:hypothetical protein